MTSESVSNLVDIESSAFNPQLQFQDFTSSVAGDGSNNARTPTNIYSASVNDNNFTNPGNYPAENGEVKSFWTWEYFQQYFDVTTDIVIERIKGAVVPKSGVNYLQQYIRNKPDLYGPVWICITLIFSIAISGNISNYLQSLESNAYHWRYNFHAVTFSATAIIAYAWLLPILLWVFLKYQGQQELQVSIPELLCIYGYSLSIYIPISVLWTIQSSGLQWFLVGTGAAISGYVLLTSISPALGQRNFILLLVLITLHILLAAGFMIHFFHTPPITTPTISNASQQETITQPSSVNITH